ncbi:hypothetical protein J6590_030842 [Homalodisca vitripennis]|nr:hypothetical protein J6590_030842 [Homalodisca vitripennis]
MPRERRMLKIWRKRSLGNARKHRSVSSAHMFLEYPKIMFLVLGHGDIKEGPGCQESPFSESNRMAMPVSGYNRHSGGRDFNVRAVECPRNTHSGDGFDPRLGRTSKYGLNADVLKVLIRHYADIGDMASVRFWVKDMYSAIGHKFISFHLTDRERVRRMSTRSPLG